MSCGDLRKQNLACDRVRHSTIQKAHLRLAETMDVHRKLMSGVGLEEGGAFAIRCGALR